MPVPISVTGFKNLAGDQNVHAEIAETASAGDWFSKMRGGGDVEKTSTTATTMDVDDETATTTTQRTTKTGNSGASR
jgi:hypothetical protein